MNLRDLNLAQLSQEELSTLREAEAKIDAQHNGKIILLAFTKE
jgi:4-hydroxyphenylpyruvate dioxygenase-like putative hemolysin